MSDLKTTENPVLDESWLRRAQLWVTYREPLRKGLLGLVVVVEASLLIYSGYVWLDYLVLSANREAQLYHDLSRRQLNVVPKQVLEAAPLQVSQPLVLPGSYRDGAYDALVKVVNSNKNWAATVRYRFGEGREREVTILNDEERFVMGEGAAAGIGAAVDFRLTDVRWQRLRNVEEVNKRKPSFGVAGVRIVPGSTLGLGANTQQVQFSVANDSVYDFWSVGFTVVPLQGDAPVIAQYTTVEKFLAGETREVKLNVVATTLNATQVLVLPDVNILDAAVFMTAAGEQQRF